MGNYICMLQLTDAPSRWVWDLVTTFRLTQLCQHILHSRLR